MVPPPSARVSRVPAYSGPPHAWISFAYGAFTLSGRLSQSRSARQSPHLCGPIPRCTRASVWPPPLSLAATHGIDVSFSSSPYLDVSVQAVPLRTLWIHVRMHEVCSCGFPHSDTHGSMAMCASPWLFAACRVLHRLPVPRHPPCALTCLATAPCIALHGTFAFSLWNELFLHYYKDFFVALLLIFCFT